VLARRLRISNMQKTQGFLRAYCLDFVCPKVFL
jgi:hypothetical protein